MLNGECKAAGMVKGVERAKRGGGQGETRSEGGGNDYVIQNGSAFVVLSSVQNGLSHAVGILSSGPFPLSHVDIGGNLLPTCLNIQLC